MHKKNQDGNLPWPKKHLTENIIFDKKLDTELRKKLVKSYVWSNRFIWLRDLDTKKIRAEVFGELRNVVLDEYGEDKMARENNQ